MRRMLNPRRSVVSVQNLNQGVKRLQLAANDKRKCTDKRLRSNGGGSGGASALDATLNQIAHGLDDSDEVVIMDLNNLEAEDVSEDGPDVPVGPVVSDQMQETFLALIQKEQRVDKICCFIDDIRQDKVGALFSTLHEFTFPVAAVVQNSLNVLGITETANSKAFTTPLITALLLDRGDLVVALVEKFGNVIDLRKPSRLTNIATSDGLNGISLSMDLLMWAIIAQHNEIIRLTVLHGNLYQAMWTACNLGQLEAVRILVTRGRFSVDQRMVDPLTGIYKFPIDIAVAHPDGLPLVKYLVGRDVAVRKSAIFSALENDRTEMTAFLLTQCSPNTVESVFLKAVRDCSLDIVEKFLQHADNLGRLADVKLSCGASQGSDYLMAAAQRGDAAVIRLLLRYLAESNSTPDADTASTSSSSVASRNALPATFLNQTDRAGSSALHYAVRSGAFESAILLLNEGCDPILPDATGQTPLELAALDISGLEFIRNALPFIVNVAQTAQIQKYDGSKQTSSKGKQSAKEKKNVCSICLEAEAVCALVPCGHLGFCEVDAQNLVAVAHRCPICRKLVDRYLVVFPCYAE